MAKEQKPEIREKIKEQGIISEMRESYLAYAMSVIVSRALPDVRDGLKPVQRRILYSMYDSGLRHNSKTVKSARIVGNTMGRFHPHGDAAIYDALVRMAQPFSLRYPLIVGQGNFGSIDNDPPAAQRYTEAKPSALAEEMLQDIEKNTVEFRPNYDNSLEEPAVLPAKLPNLLINGSMGIAVGMATNIPPHNLSEVVEAMQHLLKNEKAKTEDLLKFIKGPDFPTGGTVFDQGQMLSAYSTGKGSVLIRGKAEIEQRQAKKKTVSGWDIVISEIPYEVNKASLIAKIADLVESKKVDGIRDIRDESNKDGIRVVVELKTDVQPQRILNLLYKYTDLQKAYHFNMVALVNGIQPKILSLKEFLEEFLNHRKIVVTRRTEYDLARTKDRIHILEGLATALDHIDEIIELIKKSKDKLQARENLMKKFKLSEKQAEAILAIRLESLAKLESEKIYAELREKKKLAKELQAILDDPKKVIQVIDAELAEVKEKFGDSRKTQIDSGQIKEFKDEDLIKQESVIITLSQEDYIRRLNPESFRVQKRGGKGVTGFETKEKQDIPLLAKVCQTHDLLLFFTNTGKVFFTKAYEIPESSRLSRGKPVNNFLNISADEKVVALISYQEKSSQAKYLILATEKGVVKKLKIDQVLGRRRNGSRVISLKKNDSLIGADFSSGQDQVILISQSGQSIRFAETNIRAQGKASQGVRGMGLKKDDKAISLNVIEKNKAKTQKILVITEKGFGKFSALKDYRLQTRAGSGIKTAKLNEKVGRLILGKAIDNEEELIILSHSGQALRIQLESIPVLSRATQGVKLINLAEKDRVATAAVL
ncbi:MAG: DNA gyrase subunit A [Patescibacteria group bacterium]